MFLLNFNFLYLSSESPLSVPGTLNLLINYKFTKIVCCCEATVHEWTTVQKLTTVKKWGIWLNELANKLTDWCKFKYWLLNFKNYWIWFEDIRPIISLYWKLTLNWSNEALNEVFIKSMTVSFSMPEHTQNSLFMCIIKISYNLIRSWSVIKISSEKLLNVLHFGKNLWKIY